MPDGKARTHGRRSGAGAGSIASADRRWTRRSGKPKSANGRPTKIAIWAAIALLGGVAWFMLAIIRGETVNAIWFVFASVCTYLIGYRFYSKVIERYITRPNDRRATPAEYKADGKDYVRTDRNVLFGHHFAAIAGAGPLVGPVIAAQMGYLPGTIWIIIGVVLAGAVQDYLVLFFSMRRGGRSLGQMAREELGVIGGTAALIATLLIMVIIVAILALVVVNALGESPWGVFSVGMTIPIALFMGVYLRFIRPGKVLEVSLIGFVLLMAAIIGGGAVAETEWGAAFFHLDKVTIAWGLIVYGFIAAILPGVAAPGTPRLPLHVHEDRRHRHAGAGHHRGPPRNHRSGLQRVRQPRERSGVPRGPLPVPLRHHCLRRAVRLPRPDLLRHHTEADRKGTPDPPHRLRRHADGILRGHHGPRGGHLHRPRAVLRHELPGRPDRRHGGNRRHLGQQPGACRREHHPGPPGGDRQRTSARKALSPAPAVPPPWPWASPTSCSSSSAARP